MPRRTIDELSWDECFELLAREGVGRVVYADELGPAAVPVNYVVAAGAIIFRSASGSKIDALLREQLVAFEVDRVDAADRSGWSVLVRGTGEVIDFELVPELIRSSGGSVPLPWKRGVHSTWVKITPTIVTGRRLADFAFDQLF